VLRLENNYHPENLCIQLDTDSVEQINIETGALSKVVLAILLCPVYHFTAQHCRKMHFSCLKDIQVGIGF
jgi:hypothetical protein